MSKVIKGMELDDLRRTFSGVREMVVLSMVKLSAQGEYQFRKALRAKNIKVRQVKNTLTRKVLREMNFSIPDNSPYWQKPTVIAWGGGSIKELSKAVEAELKGPKTAALYKEKIIVKGAVADGQPVAFEDALKLPTRLELIGEIIGGMLGAVSAIAGGLTGPVSQVASQIVKISEKKEEAPTA